MKNIPWERWASIAVCIAAAGAGILICGKLLAVYLLPFVLAWLLSLFITPAADRMASKLHWSPKLCGILLLTAVLSLTFFSSVCQSTVCCRNYRDF